MLDQIKSRKSVRKYKKDSIDKEIIHTVIEAARLAPSGSNTQPWNFIITESEDMRKKIAKASNSQNWMLTAPVYITAVADIKCRIKDSDGLVLTELSDLFEVKQIIRDTALSVSHILLEAENQGLSTCVVADFTQEDIRAVLNIPADKFVVSVITLGYADFKSSADHKRRDLKDIIRYEKWQP